MLVVAAYYHNPGVLMQIVFNTSLIIISHVGYRMDYYSHITS